MSAARWIAVGLTLGAASCAGDLRKDRGGGAAGGGARVESEDGGDGSIHTRIDATKNDLWVFLDLEADAEVFPAVPGTSRDWDLGFQRFKIITNSGISGSGGMETVALPGAIFEEIARAPASGYVVDLDDSGDDGTDPDYAFLASTGWYNYDLGGHGLTARDIVYVVKTVEAHYYKVQMLGYYDDVGTGGYPRFRWAPVDAP